MGRPTLAAAPVEIVLEDEPPEGEPNDDTPSTSTVSPAADPAAGEMPPPVDATAPSEAPVTAATEPTSPVEPTTNADAAAPDTAPVSTPDADSAETTLATLQERLTALETEVADLRTAGAAAKVEQKQRLRNFVRLGQPIKGSPLAFARVGFGRAVAPEDYGVRISGYLQLQYQWSALSEDEIDQSGTPLNRNLFVIRRGRIRVAGDWRFTAFEFELDGSTTRGPFVGIRQAHVSALWRHKDSSRPPLMQLLVGLTEVPFGFENRLGQREMPFMERTLGSLSFFPGPVDVGVRLRGGVGPFRYDVAVMNGTPLDDRAGANGGFDPTRKPDIAGRLGFEILPRNPALSGGASFLHGYGFHAGTPATKNTLAWQDLNENGSLDSGETLAIPGQAATPSVVFDHWAVNVDLQFGIRTKAGWTRLLGEGTIGTNFDRGLVVSDPVFEGADLRQIQAYGAILQDVTRYAFVGFRYDYYDPYTDALDRRRGSFVPNDTSIQTLSPLVAGVLPSSLSPGFRARFSFQYDAVFDHLGRDDRGVPENARNDQFTFRVQGEF